MIGAITGDVVGSIYEWNNIKSKEFPLFQNKCFFTDDTVMTVAVAEALMNGGTEEDFITSMKKFGRMYPDAGYGGRFGAWLFSEDSKAYNSWGNGSAMRVSPVGFFVKPDWSDGPDFSLVDRYARASAGVTHNHPEGIKGAKATAECILFMRIARQSGGDIEAWKDRLRNIVTDRFGYDLRKTLNEIRPFYQFDESCQGTVPQAITAFLESNSFEDAIRNAISLGGDSDTLAAITGGIAEAAYGVPAWIVEKTLSYLDQPLREVCQRWRDTVGNQSDHI